MPYQVYHQPLHYRFIRLIKRHKTACCISVCLIVFLIIYLLSNRNNLVYLSDNIAIPYEYLRRSDARQLII